ncbi:hypothetical protein MAPG_02284 [Magnaporthiopsis poae ATCC 64411]|uniref:Uncharacterized protein n=1 Tax=Magnaporthiopsis poae (strain ATCC 64411 / 73-15) TaxID=644358 RepID=A0A0C4DQY5_MAGP6|nr:hypothetical protein MAPG_02284 [Magnaporthiopsis poae ATCC 64411]
MRYGGPNCAAPVDTTWPSLHGRRHRPLFWGFGLWSKARPQTLGGMHRPRSGLPSRFRRFQDTLPLLKKREQIWPRGPTPFDHSFPVYYYDGRDRPRLRTNKTRHNPPRMGCCRLCLPKWNRGATASAAAREGGRQSIGHQQKPRLDWTGLVCKAVHYARQCPAERSPTPITAATQTKTTHHTFLARDPRMTQGATRGEGRTHRTNRMSSFNNTNFLQDPHVFVAWHHGNQSLMPGVPWQLHGSTSAATPILVVLKNRRLIMRETEE